MAAEPVDRLPPARLARRDGRRRLPLVVCDVDGTINDERWPEPIRLMSVGPARAALGRLREPARAAVPVVLATARSLAEARAYARAVGAGGVCIGEDGAALAVGHRDHCIAPGARGGRGELWRIRRLLREVRGRHPARTLVASCDRPHTWPGSAGAAEREILRRSRGRLATAIVLGDTAASRADLERLGPAHGLRTFGQVLNVLPAAVDKGTALRHLDRHAGAIFGCDADGILPLAFGNGPNDLPLLRAAHDLGGCAVLVGADGVEPGRDRPAWLHRIALPHGHGVAAGLERLLPGLLCAATGRSAAGAGR